MSAQLQVKSKRDSTTNLKIKTVEIPKGDVVIVYPIPEPFSHNVMAIIDYGKKREYLIEPNAFLSETYEVKRRKKTKTKTQKMTFNSEAELLNYLLKKGFEFVGGPKSSFILRKK